MSRANAGEKRASLRARRRSRGRVSVLVALITLAIALPGFGPASATPSFAVQALLPTTPGPATPASASSDRLVSVIVKLTDAPVATYRGGVAGLAATSPRVTGVKRINTTSAVVRSYRSYLAGKLATIEGAARSAIPRARVLHRYDMVIGGLALQLPEKDVGKLTAMPGVQAVYPDTRVYAVSEKSPQFIGAPALWGKVGGPKKAGEGIIVGVIDSGIWPEHPSLADPDPSGKAYTAPPGSRACQFSGGANPGPAFACNGKLIGAYRFLQSHDAVVGVPPDAFTTARDDDGHGTHTATTAAGNGRVKAEVFGVKRGTVSGIAPRAHVIAYKALGSDNSGFGSDLVAAVQQAILDGVDVINYSVSGPPDPYADAVDLAFRDAYAANVFVAAAACNDGPARGTTCHNGGWVTTVAASTEKQQYLSKITFTADNRDKLTLKGVTVTPGLKTALPVILASSVGDPLCDDGTPDGAFAGKIVLCERNGSSVPKERHVLARGAVGMIVFNPAEFPAALEMTVLPSVVLASGPSSELDAFLGTHSGITAKFTTGALARAQGDVMAAFSSRGGESFALAKPDVSAPGVTILAGNTPEGAGDHIDGELFQVISGTSMATPHVAGAAAVLRQLHPSWTPGRLKSALMTSALRKNLVKEDGVTPVDAYDAGSGRIALGDARDPGLTFDVPVQDYIDHQTDLWTVNYPSIHLPLGAPEVITVQRTARSELAKPSTWKVKVTAPADVVITAPAQITVPAGGTTPIAIGIDKSAMTGAERFAALDLTYKGYLVHLPITLTRAANLRINSVSSSSPVTIGGTITLAGTIANVGPRLATGVLMTFYVSTDAELSGDDLAVGTCNFGDLAAASNAPCSGTIPFNPPGFAPGTYRVLAVADPANAVIESDETDNVAATGPIVFN